MTVHLSGEFTKEFDLLKTTSRSLLFDSENSFYFSIMPADFKRVLKEGRLDTEH